MPDRTSQVEWLWPERRRRGKRRSKILAKENRYSCSCASIVRGRSARQLNSLANHSKSCRTNANLPGVRLPLHRTPSRWKQFAKTPAACNGKRKWLRWTAIEKLLRPNVVRVDFKRQGKPEIDVGKEHRPASLRLVPRSGAMCPEGWSGLGETRHVSLARAL